MMDWLFSNDPVAAARRNAYPTQYREYQGPSPRAPHDPGAAARRNAYPTQYREHYDGAQEQYDDYQEPQIQRASYAEPQTACPGEVRITKSANGHYYANATIEGKTERMLIDSGATGVVLSHRFAKKLGMNLRNVTYNTAVKTGGGIIYARRFDIPKISVEGITAYNVDAVVHQHDCATGDIIGMSFLNQLSGGYSVQGNTMILRP